MRKLVTIGLSICLALGLAGLSVAGKDKKNPPANIVITDPVDAIEGTCSWGEDEIAINMNIVSPLEVSWTATQNTDEPLYYKFGGDAKFIVFQVQDGGNVGDPMPTQDVVVEIGLMLEDLESSNDPDGPYEPMDNEFVYDDEGTTKCTSPCTANLNNIQLAIMLALDEQFGYADWTITEGVSFLGVFLKAMNPGKGNRSQDYVQEVCGFYEVMEPEVAAAY
mgnify:CR=1 FL=1